MLHVYTYSVKWHSPNIRDYWLSTFNWTPSLRGHTVFLPDIFFLLTFTSFPYLLLLILFISLNSIPYFYSLLLSLTPILYVSCTSIPYFYSLVVFLTFSLIPLHPSFILQGHNVFFQLFSLLFSTSIAKLSPLPLFLTSNL